MKDGGGFFKKGGGIVMVYLLPPLSWKKYIGILLTYG